MSRKMGMLIQFWLKRLVFLSIKALHKTSQCIISLSSSLLHILSCLLLYYRDKDFVHENWDFIMPTSAKQKLRKEKAGHYTASSHLRPINYDHNYSQYCLSTLWFLMIKHWLITVLTTASPYGPSLSLSICYPDSHNEFNIMQ